MYITSLSLELLVLHTPRHPCSLLLLLLIFFVLPPGVIPVVAIYTLRDWAPIRYVATALMEPRRRLLPVLMELRRRILPLRAPPAVTDPDLHPHNTELAPGLTATGGTTEAPEAAELSAFELAFSIPWVATALMEMRRKLLPILPLRAPPAVTDPDLHRRNTEVALGLTAGTGQALKAAGLSALVMAYSMGCWIDLLREQIQVEDIKARPTQICCAILLATVLGVLWHRFWAPLRTRFSDNSLLILTSSGSSTAASTSQTPWRCFSNVALLLLRCFSNLALLGLLSGVWVWEATFSIASTAPWPTFQDQFKEVLMAEGVLWFLTIFFNAINMLSHQEDNDVHSLELQGPRRGPDQFEDGTSCPAINMC